MSLRDRIRRLEREREVEDPAASIPAQVAAFFRDGTIPTNSRARVITKGMTAAAGSLKTIHTLQSSDSEAAWAETLRQIARR
jgi:hypothetical protein